MTEASMRHQPGSGRRAVGLLAGARLVSVAGSQAAQVALVYTIYQRTRSSAWVSAALFALVAVTGLLGPLSGWIGDRFDRRRVMITSELAAGVVWVGLLAVDAPWLLVALALAATAAGAPFRAASAATIPNIVDDDDLTWANGIVAGSFNAALVVGPLIGGALVAASGSDAVFMVNAGSYVASAALLTRLPADRAGDRGTHLPVTGIMVGFRVVAHDRSLRRLVAVTALSFAAFGVTLVADLPLADHFDAGSVGYGLLTALWGLGAVAGSWAAARWLRPSGEALGLALGTAAMAVSLGSIAAMPAFASIVLVGTIGGIGSGYAFTPWFTMVQRQTEDVHRGRVFAAAEACEQGAFVVGMLVAGWIVDAVGPRPTYLVPGMLLALGAAIAARIWRSIPASVAVPAARPPSAVAAERPVGRQPEPPPGVQPSPVPPDRPRSTP
ncbi:MAG TPA: MFS transporter [Jiangellaceae bacterium]|nr:MFS transporter [Jiangellaceae bacterium]